jgi:type IV pilus assembly protein PilC
MSSYSYIAIDPRGLEMRGNLEVTDQNEALRRIKEMGLFPVRVVEAGMRKARLPASKRQVASRRRRRVLSASLFGDRVKPARLAVFTRQLATLVEAGMPLLRSLKTLQEQEEDRVLRRILGELAESIENGSSLAEAVAAHPRIFNPLYLNMVRAGEIGGALEVTLRRLAEFMEKAQKIKGKIKAAMFYPCAVLVVAASIMTILMVFVVPKFKAVFDGLLNGVSMPAFSLFVFSVSEAVKNHLLPFLGGVVALAIMLSLALRTTGGRWAFDRFKLAMPILGPLFRKAAISKFSRTLGTLVSNGVPILQSLTIVRETAGNVVISQLIASVHNHVKQGDPIAPTLKSSPVFPSMVAGMVDVGEQTGALPDMLLKIADNYDDEVDNAASAMTSLLEPIMIVCLAVIVGSIVIAMFWPLVVIMENGFDQNGPGGDGS